MRRSARTRPARTRRRTQRRGDGPRGKARGRHSGNAGARLCNVKLETGSGIAIVTLNRPRARNAIDARTIDELHAVLDHLAESDTTRVLVLTGAGREAFAAGADIRELLKRRAGDALRGINSGLFLKLENFPMPTIAAIRGHALGGGLELALACDLRISGTSARFGQPEVGLGIIPAAGATLRLPRIIGMGRAREMILTGNIIDAEEAYRIGLVNRIVDDDDVLDEARAVAASIARKGPLALRVAKLALSASAYGAEAGHAAERLGQGILFESEDKNEGMTAFLERRRPRFRGR
ncbi:MAG: enoyl-CoA hydratase-related protein [Acidobacteria bacterium]|nr:enoyl-CoA hydratase-related protein [Acidobacteriota bacterium]